MQPAGARRHPQQERMLFPFPGGQGNLIFALPACSGSLLWSVTGRWLGGSQDTGFLRTRWRAGAGGNVGAGAWPWCSWRNVQTQSCPGARPWKSQGSAAGEEWAHFGVCNLACLLLSSGLFYLQGAGLVRACLQLAGGSQCPGMVPRWLCWSCLG